MSDSLEYILACQICLDDFEETGEHVPRILPCHHSLCEKCLKELIEMNFVECPECRKRHRVVDNEVKTFPQNKYILANIRKKETDIVKNDQTSETLDKCEKHGKELSLYCKGPKCSTKICQTCLTRSHRGEGHDVVEIEEIEKEVLFRKMEVAVKDLKERKDYILGVQKNAEKENMESIKKITARKEELIQKINQRHEQMVAEVRQKEQNVFTEKLKMIEEHLDLLRNIKDNVDKEVITRQEIKVEKQKATSIEQGIEGQLSSKVEYNLLKFEEVGSISEDVERLCGHLQESTKYLRLEKKISFAWKAVKSLWMNVKSVTPVDKTCIAILYDGSKRLMKYRGCLEGKIQEVQLNNEAISIVEVELVGQPCLAVTYRQQTKIEFRDAKDFNTVVLEHSVSIDRPGIMCASSNSSLWYETFTPGHYLENDYFYDYPIPDYYYLHQLDCSSSRRSPVEMFTCRKRVYDMCCAELEGNPLLVTVSGYRGVTAYNTSTKESVWSTERDIPLIQKDMFARGITTDEHGRLFVLDTRNKCIHVFSVHGKYVTTMLRKGEQGIAEPRQVRWSEGLSGLIVVHGKDKNTRISLIKIQS